MIPVRFDASTRLGKVIAVIVVDAKDGVIVNVVLNVFINAVI